VPAGSRCCIVFIIVGIIITTITSYFAENYKDKFDGMRHFGGVTDYPASTVSINISDMILSLLNCPVGPSAQTAGLQGEFFILQPLFSIPCNLPNCCSAMAIGHSKGHSQDVEAAVAALTDLIPVPRS
jgi:hypothetical protein